MLHLCLLIVGIGASSTFCMAADKGSIQIEYHSRTKEDAEILLDDVEFVLYYVGSVNGEQWKIADEFLKAEIPLENDESSERKKQAEQLYAYALNKKIEGNIQKTDVNGITKFTNLKEGVYLVAQVEDWQRSGIGTFHSSPFFVSVPSEISGILTWEVVSKPKGEWIPQEENKPPRLETESKVPSKVNTGDSISMGNLIVAIISSTLLIGILWRKKKYTKYHNIIIL